MRERVTREQVELFLQEFGRRVRKPVRLVLTGGASMILRGLRKETEDIDFSYAVAPTDDRPVIEAIQELKHKLNVSLELAEPGQFIPMPAGRERRLSYVNRYGSTDVFLDDPYAIAISKLHRGHGKDRRDVKLLLDAGIITGEELVAKVREVAAATTPTVINVDPERMLVQLEAARRGEF